MSDSDISQADVKLKVGLLVKSTYSVMYGNPSALLKMVWVVFLLNGLYTVYRWDTLFQPATSTTVVQSGNFNIDIQLGGLSGLVGWAEALVGLLLLSGVFVAIHRFVLLGNYPHVPGFGIGKRELRYFGQLLINYSLVIVALLIPFALLIMIHAGAGYLFGATGAMLPILTVLIFVGMFVGALTIITRLWFVMPAIAVDQGGVRFSIRRAWAMAKGHTATMIAAVTIALLPIFLISGISNYFLMQLMLQHVTSGETPIMPMAVYYGISVVVEWVGFVVITVMYSIAYNIIESNNAEQQVEA